MQRYVPAITIIAILLVVFVAIALSRNQEAVVVPSPSPLATPTPVGSPSSPSPSPTIPANWQTYVSPNQAYSISYPPDVRVQQNTDNSVSFILIGPTQTQGTELFDGFNLTIASGQYANDTLADFVQSELARIQSEPATESVSSIRSILVAGIQGYQLVEISGGEFTHIYLSDGDKQYLRLTLNLEDPGNRGYQETVNSMLSTLDLEP